LVDPLHARESIQDIDFRSSLSKEQPSPCAPFFSVNYKSVLGVRVALFVVFPIAAPFHAILQKHESNTTITGLNVNTEYEFSVTTQVKACSIVGTANEKAESLIDNDPFVKLPFLYDDAQTGSTEYYYVVRYKETGSSYSEIDSGTFILIMTPLHSDGRYTQITPLKQHQRI